MRKLRELGEKLDLVPRSAMLTSRHRVVRELGQQAFGLKELVGVRRTRWLVNRDAVPAPGIVFRPPRPVSEADLEICQRLIEAHSKAVALERGPAADGRWAWLFETHQRDLAEALDRGEPAGLAELLAGSFAADFMLGSSFCPQVRRAESRFGRRAWEIKALDGIVSLAEVLGVAPVDNPERGSTGTAFLDGLPALVERIEERLGFRLDFPDLGAPCGIEVDGRLISPETPDQVYASLRLREAVEAAAAWTGRDPEGCSLVEVGAGYGALCYWFHRHPDHPTGSYTIVDLPIVNVLHGYFLASTLGPDRVSFYGEPAADVRILPSLAVDQIETPFDVFVNKDGLPEMPREAMLDYLRLAADQSRLGIYSYNQEAAVEFDGERQGVVHESLAEIGGMRRISRNRSWLRDGYVEEVYVPDPPAAL